MKKIFTLLALSIFTLSTAFSQMQATLLGNWQDDDLIVTSWLDSRYNEVWGVAINGGEYGIIGSTEGVHIIDVTDPSNIYEAARVDGSAIGTNLVHRDYKTYNGYLYCVADEGGSSTLQIIDLQDLPNSVSEVYSSNEFVVTAHNIFIDEDNARLYIIGDGSGLRVLDISTPDQPVLLADNNATPVPYCHDAYVRDHIAYLNCGNQGFYVVDYTDPVNHVILGTMTDYPEDGYNHSGWLSDDGQYYFLLDETHSTSVKTVDVSDFTNMNVVALFSPDVWEDEIPHNAIVRGDRLYTSYYYDGLQVWDIADPMAPELIAYHDTYCEPNVSFFAGMWGMYPLLPSGNILCSDMQTGLYLFEHLPEVTLDLSLKTTQAPAELCEGTSVTVQLALGEDYSTDGINLTTTAPAGVTVDFSANPAQPGDEVEATISADFGFNLPFSMEVYADDGNFGASLCYSFIVNPAAGIAELQVPADTELLPIDDPAFNWASVFNVTQYNYQIADNTGDFDAGLLYSDFTSSSNYTLDQPDVDAIMAAGSGPYYWRVLTENDCGEVSSDVWSFDFMPNATGELNGAALNIFPSPATDKVFVQFDQAISEELQVELTTLTGQVLSQNDFAAGENTLTLDVSDFAAGIYLLKITGGDAAHVQRVVVE